MDKLKIRKETTALNKSSVIVEIGTSKVICLVFDKNAFDENSIIGMGVAEYKSTKNGLFPNHDEAFHALGRAVKEAEAQSGKKIKNAYVCVPAEQSVVVARKSKVDFGKEKNITPHDIEHLFKAGEEGLRREGYRIIQRCPISFSIDNMVTMEPVGNPASVIKALVSYIFARQSFIKSVYAMFEKLGLDVIDFVSAMLGQALSFIQPQERDNMAIVLDIGYATSSIFIVKGDGILFTESFSTGGRNISRDIAAVNNVTYEFAEQLKRRCVFGLDITENDCYEAIDKATMKLVRFPAAEIHQVVEARINEMLDEYFAAINRSDIQIRGKIILHLTGGGISFMRGIRDYIYRNFDIETVIAEPRGTRLNKPTHSAIAGVLEIISKEYLEEDAGLLARIKSVIKF